MADLTEIHAKTKSSSGLKQPADCSTIEGGRAVINNKYKVEKQSKRSITSKNK